MRGKGSGGKRRMNPPLSLGLRGPPAPLYHPEGESGGGRRKKEGTIHFVPSCRHGGRESGGGGEVRMEEVWPVEGGGSEFRLERPIDTILVVQVRQVFVDSCTLCVRDGP